MLGFTAGVSYSAEETRKRLMKAWEDPASKFKGAAKLLARDWEGMMSMLGDAWFAFRNDVMDAGVFDWLKAAVQLVLDKISELKKDGSLKAWAAEIGENVVGAFETLIELTAMLADGWHGLKMIANAVALVWAASFEALAFSARSRQHTMLKKLVCSCHSPSWLRQRRFTAIPRRQLAAPLGVNRISGSVPSPERPI